MFTNDCRIPGTVNEFATLPIQYDNSFNFWITMFSSYRRSYLHWFPIWLGRNEWKITTSNIDIIEEIAKNERDNIRNGKQTRETLSLQQAIRIIDSESSLPGHSKFSRYITRIPSISIESLSGWPIFSDMSVRTYVHESEIRLGAREKSWFRAAFETEQCYHIVAD